MNSRIKRKKQGTYKNPDSSIKKKKIIQGKSLVLEKIYLPAVESEGERS